MDKINDYKKESLNKFLLITAIVLVIIAVVITILYIVVKNNEDTGADYSDTIVGKNYFMRYILIYQLSLLKGIILILHCKKSLALVTMKPILY